MLRSNTQHSLSIGNNCLVGANAHVVGRHIEDEVFIATGAAIFHGAKLGRGSEVRINGVVHLKKSLPAGTILPIGWVAVGDPVSIFSPDRHENIWAIQKPLNFPLNCLRGRARRSRYAEDHTQGNRSIGKPRLRRSSYRWSFNEAEIVVIGGAGDTCRHWLHRNPTFASGRGVNVHGDENRKVRHRGHVHQTAQLL